MRLAKPSMKPLPESFRDGEVLMGIESEFFEVFV